MTDPAPRQYEEIGRTGLYPDPEGLLRIVRRFSIWGIGGSDGCNCCHFDALGISVNVSCHKSEHCVRIHSSYLYFRISELFDLAKEVLSQLPNGGVGYRVRFCSYECDHVNGRWERKVWRVEHKCCWCGKPRSDSEAYLCVECLRDKPDAVEQFDSSGFIRDPASGEGGGGRE